MLLGMVGSFAVVKRLGRHLLHIGIVLIGVGAAALALALAGAHTASTWDLVPGLFLVGGRPRRQYRAALQFILTSVQHERGRIRLRRARGHATALDLAWRRRARHDLLLGLRHHLPTDALQITAWVCLAPLAVAFLLVFRLPMRAREEEPGH